MKKHQILACIATIMLFGCSKEKLNTTEQDLLKSEQSKTTILKGESQAKGLTIGTTIVFNSNSINDGVFVGNCFPTGKKLLKNGAFSGSLRPYGKINPSLSRYQFMSCEELPTDPPNQGEPLMYAMVATGKLAITAADYCTITIRGNIYPWYYTQYGFYGGLFNGTAITEFGGGKLKALDNKHFEVHATGSSNTGPSLNLETGVISLRFSETQ